MFNERLITFILFALCSSLEIESWTFDLRCSYFKCQIFHSARPFCLSLKPMCRGLTQADAPCTLSLYIFLSFLRRRESSFSDIYRFPPARIGVKLRQNSIFDQSEILKRITELVKKITRQVFAAN